MIVSSGIWSHVVVYSKNKVHHRKTVEHNTEVTRTGTKMTAEYI